MARTYKDPERVIKTVLSETESMVSLDEVRAFMRQALARSEQLDDAIDRCFGADGPTNSNESQLRRFLAAAEQMWAREAEQFDPVADAPAEFERWVGKPTEPESVFVLRVSLVGTTPKVWRQVRVPGDFSLGDLHEVIQVVMGWYGDHLHAFAVGERRYADPMDVDDPEYADEETVTLDELGLSTGGRFIYVYDFGDSWKHTIRVSRMVSASTFPAEERGAVICTAGERAAPPEDCGGTFGYTRMLELLARPRASLHANEREFLELFADEFDPDEFDIDAVNRVFRGESES